MRVFGLTEQERDQRERPRVVGPNRDRVSIGRRGRGPSASARAKRDARAEQGMTLVEIMIVIVILALVASGMTLGLGAITRARLRSACMKIVSASNFGYARAISHGSTVRVVLDFAEAKISIEEAHGNVNLARADDERRHTAEEASGGDEQAAVDPWEAARERLQTALHPTLGASPFAVISDAEGKPIARYEPQSLGDGIRIVRFYAPQEAEPRTSGKGAMYFFPGGLAQRVVVQLSDSSDRVYSVSIHPLTGRARVHAEAFQPRDIRDDASDSERSDVEDDG